MFKWERVHRFYLSTDFSERKNHIRQQNKLDFKARQVVKWPNSFIQGVIPRGNFTTMTDGTMIKAQQRLTDIKFNCISK